MQPKLHLASVVEPSRYASVFRTTFYEINDSWLLQLLCKPFHVGCPCACTVMVALLLRNQTLTAIANRCCPNSKYKAARAWCWRSYEEGW